MAITGIIPGTRGSFTATPLNKAGLPVDLPLPAGFVPVWTSDDTVNAPVVASGDGLSATVDVPVFAPAAGAVFNLSVANPDGSAATSVAVPYDAVAKDNVIASYGISQTA